MIASENINPEKLFDLWIELGKFDRIQSYLEKEGLDNEFKRKSQIQLIKRTVYRYILENPNKCLQEIRKHSVLEDEQWEIFLVQTARYMYLVYKQWREKFDEFLKENNLYDKYKDYGKPSFNRK